MPETIDAFAKWIAGILTMLGGAFGLGKYNAKIVKKAELYDEKGNPLYMHLKDAKQCKQECVDLVSKITTETDKKFDQIVDYMKQQNERHIQMVEFMGTVKQFMKNSK